MSHQKKRNTRGRQDDGGGDDVLRQSVMAASCSVEPRASGHDMVVDSAVVGAGSGGGWMGDITCGDDDGGPGDDGGGVGSGGGSRGNPAGGWAGGAPAALPKGRYRSKRAGRRFLGPK